MNHFISVTFYVKEYGCFWGVRHSFGWGRRVAKNPVKSAQDTRATQKRDAHPFDSDRSKFGETTLDLPNLRGTSVGDERA